MTHNFDKEHDSSLPQEWKQQKGTLNRGQMMILQRTTIQFCLFFSLCCPPNNTTYCRATENCVGATA